MMSCKFLDSDRMRKQILESMSLLRSLKQINSEISANFVWLLMKALLRIFKKADIRMI